MRRVMIKTLPFDKAKITEILKTYPTPFHIYDEYTLRERVRALKAAFSWNGGYREYYAVKACPNPVLLQILMEEGCGIDCSSYAELLLAKAVGAAGEDIMFSANAMPAEEFIFARKLNATINLDDFSHIDFLKENGGIPETVCCRFNPGAFRFGNAIMGDPAESKYGFTREQLTKGFLKLGSMGVKRFGLHAFLASNTTDAAYYPALAALLFQTALELHEETGAEIAFLNLSGGIGIPYRPEDKPVDIALVGEKVHTAYEKAFQNTALRPAIFTELGRYVSGPTGYLVTRAVHEKDTHKHFLGMDACAVDLMRPAMYGAYHHITVLGKEDAPYDHIYDITGALCENNDKFAVNRELPKVERGDILVLHDTGAHGYAMGYNYNGRLKHAELLLKENGDVRLIRRAEIVKDYFATLDVLGLNLEE